MSVKEVFVDRIQDFNAKQLKYKKLYSRISFLRLTIFALIVVFGYMYSERGHSIYNLLITMVLIIAFLYLMKIHSRISLRLKKIKSMIDINNNYLSRLDGEWIKFEDCGQESEDANHPYLSDLDIIGKKSLFQFINTTNTFYGRNKLITLLKNPSKDIEEIKKRQGAVNELSSKMDFCQSLECEGISNDKTTQNPDALLEYAENPNSVFKSKWIKPLIYILPVISIVSSFVIIYFKVFNLLYLIFVFFILHVVIVAVGYFKITPVINSINKFKRDLEAYINILKLIQNEDFKDSYLLKLKSDLFQRDKEVSTAIKELNKIVDSINIRYMMLYIIINILLLWDYQCLFSLEKWREKYGGLIRNWLEVIGEFESIASLSVIPILNPDWTFPEISHDNLVISGEEIGHPLINEEIRISNDVNITNNIFIITGSNMSGKTTFLRTIGINLVLAYAGAPVCAKQLKCSLLDIYTSMRISDDLSSGISTFYAELIRIKMIIDYLPKKRPMIFLIDEIFRGTNSADRIIGAKKVLGNLNKNWIIGLISTHDFELCDLENQDSLRIKNYHFSEGYKDNKIYFDYKLKKGRSNTTNAKYLMKMVGIE